MSLAFPSIIAKLQRLANSGFSRTCLKAYFKLAEVNHTSPSPSCVFFSAKVLSKSSNFDTWYLSFFLFSFFTLTSKSVFMLLSRLTVMTVGCMKTSSFILFIFAIWRISINFLSSFSTAFWSGNGIRRTFCCLGAQFSFNCAFISCPSRRPCLEKSSLNSVNNLFGGLIARLFSR